MQHIVHGPLEVRGARANPMCVPPSILAYRSTGALPGTSEGRAALQVPDAQFAKFGFIPNVERQKYHSMVNYIDQVCRPAAMLGTVLRSHCVEATAAAAAAAPTADLLPCGAAAVRAPRPSVWRATACRRSAGWWPV